MNVRCSTSGIIHVQARKVRIRLADFNIAEILYGKRKPQVVGNDKDGLNVPA